MYGSAYGKSRVCSRCCSLVLSWLLIVLPQEELLTYFSKVVLASRTKPPQAVVVSEFTPPSLIPDSHTG